MGRQSGLLAHDLRKDVRFPVRCAVSATHRTRGEITVTITNISRTGFMASGDLRLDRGESLQIALPGAGRVDACVMWVVGERLGFQFERPIRQDDFARLLNRLDIRLLPR